ncbi:MULTISPECIES: helicase-related protein [unclassified Nodularia (in: cyanobacteria)]|uniref:helicase-related protein n=1 Tax=unclassified Nodularia (in: cyanobacteria) TaxID=2656917 RepID=UPI001881C335|nr:MULTISPECIES: helicase-related protein [unclassified Nodularia (in: cyanobacteria)]MBE9199361.1 helicase [Nodularia sp. LEGE 06071]MCC2694123.1 helicase [Nodularia sp. LEGE 04288]
MEQEVKQSSFLEQASIWGQVFEIAVKRGVLQNLIHQKLLSDQHLLLKPWQEVKNADIYSQLVKTLKLTDPNAQAWVGSMVRHLLGLGYGLGWTAMRECLKYVPVRQPQLAAIWCPLMLPAQQMQREAEKEKTAQEFKAAFNLAGQPDLGLVTTGQPARADFLLWLSSGKNTRQKFEHFLLCLEFSYNAPAKLADFTTEAAHREEMSRYARYIDSRGVFSRVCAEVEGGEFLFSSSLKNHLAAFSGLDKPLFKLCQASSYTERLINLLRKQGRLEGGCSARAIAITSNGCESIAAHFFEESEPNPRTKLMTSLGEAYRHTRKLDDQPDALSTEIRVAFNKLVRSLPSDFERQAKQLRQKPNSETSLHYQFTEQVTGFYNPMQEFSQQDAIANIETTESLHKFFGSSPLVHFQSIFQHLPEQIPLRTIHESAVITGLKSAQTGRLNVIALEGNPGIGKTTAVIKFLEAQSEGFMFIYLSPRVVINRDVTAKLAKKHENHRDILTITTNAHLIATAPEWYEEMQPKGKKHCVDSAVVVDGITNLNYPDGSTIFLTPEQEHEIDCNGVPSGRFKRRRNEREDSVESIPRPGVFRTLASSARKLLEHNPQVNHLVMTAAIQGYRHLDQKTTIDALGNLFAKKAHTKPGQQERRNFAARIPTIIAMVDELAGDGAGALFVHKLADWLQQQFIEPFEGSQSPFKVILIIADASLSNEIVLNSYLNSGDSAPDKVLISPTQGEAPFRVTGTDIKIGLRKHPVLHIMTNSYPASQLNIEYSIRLSPITPKLIKTNIQQQIRQAIRATLDEELLNNAYKEIERGLKAGAEQLIFFAQDKAFLRQLKQKLIGGKNALCQNSEVEILDQSVPPNKRLELVQEEKRDKIRVFLMTSSGARGVSFPKTDWIIAAIPRFNIEAALMEVAQLIYRGRGMYTDPETKTLVSGDDKARRLVMLINDGFVVEEDIDNSRRWLRQSSDLLTLLMMLRSTIHTRIKGDAGLKNQRLALVPVGSVGDEELLNLMSDDVWTFLQEARVFVYDHQSEEEKGIVKKAEMLTRQIFAEFTLKGNIGDRQAKSYVDYANLEAFIIAVSTPLSLLLPSLENANLVIPDYLTCIGPFWMEDWSNRRTEEKFSFEGWRKYIQEHSQQLLGLLRVIYQDKNGKFPPKLKRPAKELHQLLIREKEESTLEYSTLQSLRTQNIVVSIPLDYPHFWRKDSDDDSPKQVLEEPDTWKKTLGRSLTPQGLVMPVVPQYKKFPWAAVAGRRVFSQLETIFSDRYFLASSELNLLNSILLVDALDDSV